MPDPRDSSIDAATAPPHLRDVAIAAAVAGVVAKRWDRDREFAEHRNHAYRAGCAVCDRAVDLVVPVALDAADAAIRDLDDALLDHLQDAEGELRAALDLHRTMLRRVALGGWRIVSDAGGGWFWQHIGPGVGHEVICLSDPELSVFEALRAKETPDQ